VIIITGRNDKDHFLNTTGSDGWPGGHFEDRGQLVYGLFQFVNRSGLDQIVSRTEAFTFFHVFGTAGRAPHDFNDLFVMVERRKIMQDLRAAKIGHMIVQDKNSRQPVGRTIIQEFKQAAAVKNMPDIYARILLSEFFTQGLEVFRVIVCDQYVRLFAMHGDRFFQGMKSYPVGKLILWFVVAMER
jgi:hypothetical protein